MSDDVTNLVNLGELDGEYEKAKPADPGGTFELIPEDTEVVVTVVSQKPDFVGSKRTPTCKVVFSVVSPEMYKGRKIWHDFWLTIPNVPYLKRDLGILGWSGRPTSLLEETDVSLLSLSARVVVGVESYDGAGGKTKHKNVIKFFKERASNQEKKPAVKEPDDTIPF